MENKNVENKILETLRFNIAMSEFGKDYTMKKNKIKKYYFSIKKVAIFIIAILLLTGIGVQAKNIIEEFTNKEVYTTASISNAINNGFVENIDMEYIYSDNIGLKINSLFMSDNDMSITLDFSLSSDIELDGKILEYGYILYNENNEVYFVQRGTNKNIISEFCKENDIKSWEEPDFQSARSSYVTYTKNNIVINELISAQNNFSKAKKLYIKVVGIGYENEDGNYKSLSKSEWTIELDIPDKFYETSVVKYTLKEYIKGIDLEQAFISDTSMTFIATIKGINGNHDTCIIDGNGNEYKSQEISYTGLNGDRILIHFPINKNMITDKLYLKTYVDGEEKVIQLISN